MFVVLVLLVISTLAGTAHAASTERLPVAEANDNLRPAGTLHAGTLNVALRAAAGRWQPEGTDGPSLEIEAFGEVNKPLMVPAPLIRMVEGTEVVVSVRNDLNATLVVHGLCARGGASCPLLEVPVRETREVRFRTGPAGTYHYWATTIGAPIPFRELAGAFIIDRAEERELDRVLVITEWSSLTPQELGRILAADDPTEVFVGLKPRLTFVINGLAWPATKRLTYHVGERVRWRVINLSSQPHPLHLHGFYFEVNSLGNGLRDTIFDDRHRRRVVTQLLPPSGTLTMSWVPERAGNWLFHCHVMHHVSPTRRLSGGRAHHDDGLGMAGMVIGVTVREGADTKTPHRSSVAARKLTLTMQEVAGGGAPAAGFTLGDGARPASDAAAVPGPPIVVRRDEPVEITVVNRLAEATAIHWHGMELESYYDGVHGFSGSGRRVTPMIAPGASFVVRFTPPRAGTFIYHTHVHDYRQLSSGLYGPLIVTGNDETFDPVTDQVIVIGRSGLVSEEPSILTEPESVVINGQRAPRLVWKSGARHRVRMINITPDDIFTVTLQGGEGPVNWKPIAKDGAPLPPGEAVATPARQTIAVGETYDFEFDAPPGRRPMWLEVRTPGGKWQAQVRVLLR